MGNVQREVVQPSEEAPDRMDAVSAATRGLGRQGAGASGVGLGGVRGARVWGGAGLEQHRNKAWKGWESSHCQACDLSSR